MRTWSICRSIACRSWWGRSTRKMSGFAGGEPETQARASNGLARAAGSDGSKHRLDFRDHAGERHRRHLEVRVIGYALVVRREELCLLPELRQLAAGSVQ